MKRKHVTLTLEQKYMVLKDIENGLSHSKAARKYNIGKSTVRDIKRKENEIQTIINKGGISTKKRKTLKASTYKKTEEALFLWFVQERNNGIHISDEFIKANAMKIHAKLEPEKQFNASNAWCSRFKKRYGLKMVGDNDSADNNLSDGDEDMPLAEIARAFQENNETETDIQNSNQLGNADNDIIQNKIVSRVNIKEEQNASPASSYVSNSESNFTQSEESSIMNPHVSIHVEENHIENSEQNVSSLLALKSADILISYSEDHHFPLQDILLLRKLRDKIEATF